MEPYLVFFDVDGTLLFSIDDFPKENIDALHRLQAAGHRIVINSGRSRANITPVLTDAVAFDGFICGGTYVEYGGKLLHHRILDAKTVRHACAYALGHGVRMILEGEERNYSVNGGLFHSAYDITSEIDAYLADPDRMKITKVTFDRPLPEADLHLIDGLHIINFPRYSEGLAEGYNKAFGMKLLSEYTGIPQARTVAFGDSANDIEMLRYAATGVIMRDAEPVLDAYATLRTQKNREGVAEGIAKLFFGENA